MNDIHGADEKQHGSPLLDLTSHNIYRSAVSGGPYTLVVPPISQHRSGRDDYYDDTGPFTCSTILLRGDGSQLLKRRKPILQREMRCRPADRVHLRSVLRDAGPEHLLSADDPVNVNRPVDITYDPGTGHISSPIRITTGINEFDPALPCWHVATHGSFGSQPGNYKTPTGIVSAPDGCCT